MKAFNFGIITGLVFIMLFSSIIINYKIAESEEMEGDKVEIEVINVVELLDKEIERLRLEQIENELQEIREKAKDKFNGRKYRVEKLIVTAYAPFDNKSGICNDGNPSTTATGTRPDWGTVAVNPKRFPYGTEFYIEGYGYGIAKDTGGAMRRNSNKIDVFVETYNQAIEWWGKREVEVIIFEKDVK